MALINLTSDLSEFFKKEPSKPTGRFQQPDKDMSVFDIDGKLESYKRPEIQMDLAGNPIIPTGFEHPDTKTRYIDNFESQLVKLASVDVTETNLSGRFEVSPIDADPIAIAGNNETSDFQSQQTDPKGRFENSDFVIPETDPKGRFTVSGVDPIISVLKGRFEISEIEPVQSVLEGYQVKTDGNGNELPSHISITNTTTFGIQSETDESPALYQYGKAINFDGTLVNINNSDIHTFLERPIKDPGVLPYTTDLDFHSLNPNAIPTNYSTVLNTMIGSSFNIQGHFISSDIIQQNIQYEGVGGEEFWASDPNVTVDQPFRIGSLIDTLTEQYDIVRNKYTTDFSTIGFIEPDAVTIHTLQDISAIDTAPTSYLSQLTPLSLSHTIPFIANYFEYDYSIINTAVSTTNQGQTYTVPTTATSPHIDITISGFHTGLIENLLNNDNSKTGLDMVQSFVVAAQDTVVPIQEVTITGEKNTYPTTITDSQTIATGLFGGATLNQQGSLLNSFQGVENTEMITLQDQIDSGVNFFSTDFHAFGFTPNMTQNFSAGGEEGSQIVGIDDGVYTHPGIFSGWSHKSVLDQKSVV